MGFETLRDLYVDHIQDLYSSEAQILDALPKMIDKASHVRLRDAFQQHLEQTTASSHLPYAKMPTRKTKTRKQSVIIGPFNMIMSLTVAVVGMFPLAMAVSASTGSTQAVEA